MHATRLEEQQDPEGAQLDSMKFLRLRHRLSGPHNLKMECTLLWI